MTRSRPAADDAAFWRIATDLAAADPTWAARCGVSARPSGPAPAGGGVAATLRRAPGRVVRWVLLGLVVTGCAWTAGARWSPADLGTAVSSLSARPTHPAP